MPFKTLQDWLGYLEALDPSRIELGLDRSKAVLEHLGLTLPGKVITVAGTNGKGTTTALLNRLLADQGYATGHYTSPHLCHFRERIRICQELPTDQQLIKSFEAVEQARADIRLTYFEFTTLSAAYLFSRADLDFSILEVGLGGRLDATNIFEPDVALVTNIGLDHMDWLGTDLNAIATEKAGIYRAGKPAIFASENRPAAIDTEVARNEANGCFAGRDFGLADDEFWWREPSRKIFAVPKSAQFSSENLMGALAVLACLDEMPDKPGLSEINIGQSLNRFFLPGRFQQIEYQGQNFILDVAHNSDAAQLLADRLSSFGIDSLTAVFGAMSDKPLDELIQPMLSQVKEWFVVRPDTPRAASLEMINSELLKQGVAPANIYLCGGVGGIQKFLDKSTAVVVYGSFYTVGECISTLGVEID